MHDLHDLKERAKELHCLYAIDTILSDRSQSMRAIFSRVITVIPPGWQDPMSTGARIDYLGCCYCDDRFNAEADVITEPLRLWGHDIGRVLVSRKPLSREASGLGFLEEEKELLRRIAGRLGEFLEWKQSELVSDRSPQCQSHWAWRQRYAQAIAKNIDAARYSVVKIFLGGSTARGDAGPSSDIDLYIVCNGSPEQHRELAMWLDGWSQCLAEIALHQTGQPFPGGLLNVQWLVSEPSIWQLSDLQELELGKYASSSVTTS